MNVSLSRKIELHPGLLAILQGLRTTVQREWRHLRSHEALSWSGSNKFRYDLRGILKVLWTQVMMLQCEEGHVGQGTCWAGALPLKHEISNLSHGAHSKKRKKA